MYNPVPTCECQSPQEQRVFDQIEGKEDKFRKTHSRVFKLLDRFEGQKPTIFVAFLPNLSDIDCISFFVYTLT